MVLRLWIELTKLAQNTVLRLWIRLTKSVTYIYGKATLTWFEEIFEEFNGCQFSLDKGRVGRGVVLPSLHT